MLNVKLNDGKLDIYKDNNLVIKGIYPIVNLTDIIIRPVFKTYDNITDSFLYVDEQKGLNIALSFIKTGENIIVDIKAGVENGIFLSKNSVRLMFENIPSCGNILSLYLFKDWWTRPNFSPSFDTIKDRTQAISWRYAGVHFGILTVSSGNAKTDLVGFENELCASVSIFDNGYKEINTTAFIIGVNKNPYTMIKQMVNAGLKHLKIQGIPREERTYPDIFKYFGWCSWDAFYHDVNEKGIFDKAEEFQKNNFPVKWFIIDDGWSDTREGKLMSFSEDRSKFPNGLTYLIGNLKKEYNIKWLGVWHAYEGYWGGIHKDSIIAKEYKDNLYKTNNGSLIPYPSSEKGFGFWNAWHKDLKNKGVDFVKVDNQSSFINFIKDNMDVSSSSLEMHSALEASVALHFKGNIINCMGMATEDFWNRPYSAVSRNSDDFFPRIQDSFKEHALQNAYNSFVTGNMYWGDWDMFWTKHPQNINNAVFRAVSGGPVYISDKVGETDFNVLWPLVYSDGEILRCDYPGMPTVDSLYINPNEEEKPLKVFNKVGNTGVLAAFNINLEHRVVKGCIKPSDVDGLTGEKFIVYEHFSNCYNILNADEYIDLTLEDNDVKLFTIIPYNSFAAIGNTEKYISSAVIKSISISDDEINIVAKEPGKFAFVTEKEIDKIKVNGKNVVYQNNNMLYTIDIPEKTAQINIYIK